MPVSALTQKVRKPFFPTRTSGTGIEKPGTGIAFQIDVEDAIGVAHQVQTLTEAVEEEL